MFALDRQCGRLDGRWLPASAAQLLWERIVREDPELDALVSPAGLARAAATAWRRLHDYRLPLEKLAGDDSPETRSFARWCHRYLALLQQRGWVDGALAQSQVHAAAAAPGLELVGFDRLTPLQEALLAAWAAAGLEVRRCSEASAQPAVWRVHCLDATAEIEAAARWAADLLHDRRDRRVAIVVPELARRRDEVRRTVERVLAPATGMTGGPLPEAQAFELAAARPLADQPVVAAALDLLEAMVRRPDLPAISRLLRNPFLSGATVEGPARARLDARIRRFETPGLGLAALAHQAAERGCPRLTQVLTAAAGVTSQWPEKSLPSDWSKRVFSLLAALGWPGEGPDSAEHQAVERWRALVSELGASDEFTGRVSRAEAVGLLRDLAGRVLFEPQELQAALLVIDPETCAGMRFDAAWVCGLDAARWPPPAMPDPFLPRHLQVRHGVPRASADLAAREAREMLDRLVASATDVVLSVPEMEDDAPLLPSPLLDAVPPRDLPPGWTAPRLATAQHAARPVLESRTDARLPPIRADEAQRGGARLLELQAACPFRAQAELRLGARTVEEPSVGVDAAERGDLLHLALAHLWNELRDQQGLLVLDAAATRTAVRRAVTAAVSEARRGADPVLRHLLDLEADWLEARVLEILQADRERPPFQVVAIEQPCTARIGKLALELRPDRVDRLADGSLAVIDYKTGADADVRAWLGERPQLPQLPAYVQALGSAQVGAVAFARVRSGDTDYAGVARHADLFPRLRTPGTKSWPRDYASWDELLGAWQRRLEVLAAEYATGDASLAADPTRACEYCPLGTLCRIEESGAAAAAEEVADD